MRTTLTAVLLSLSVLTGCNDTKGTPGGVTSGDNKVPAIGAPKDGTFILTAPGSLPWATTVKQGESVPLTIGISRGKNFDQDVALKFEGLPTGVTVEPASAKIDHSAPDAKLTLKAADNAEVGTKTVKVTGANVAGGSGAIEFKLTVKNKAVYSFNVPLTSTAVQQGGSKEVAINVSHEAGFDEDVELKFEDLPPGVTVEPSTFTVKKGEGEAKVTVKATPEAGLGEKTIKVTGHSTKGIDSGALLKVTIEPKK